MNNKLKKLLIISSIFLIIIFLIISAVFISKYIINKNIIKKVTDTYSDIDIQNRLEKTDNNLTIDIDGKTVLGVIKIDKINFEGLVYEGTEKDIIDEGVGHFPYTPYLNGNVGLAAHNTKKFWAKLYTLVPGDTISYISFLGTKEYVVENVQKIDETDFSFLEDTEDNRLTLITCVYNSPAQRLCVQAVEK